MSITLEQFIKTYNNNLKKTGIPGYAEYLSLQGIDPADDYHEALGEIESEYKRSLTGYGANAEALAQGGLTSSGYGDYLEANAYSTMQKARQDAKKNYQDALNEGRVSYASYLEKLEKNESQKLESVKSAIEEKRMLDYKSAYTYALSEGISKDSASKIAKEAVEKTQQTMKREVLNAVISGNLTKNQAITYAVYLGFSTKDAEEIGEYAYLMNQAAISSGNVPDMFKQYQESE